MPRRRESEVARSQRRGYRTMQVLRGLGAAAALSGLLLAGNVPKKKVKRRVKKTKKRRRKGGKIRISKKTRNIMLGITGSAAAVTAAMMGRRSRSSRPQVQNTVSHDLMWNDSQAYDLGNHVSLP